jgi:tRNA pseudouridine38-40 synthase
MGEGRAAPGAVPGAVPGAGRNVMLVVEYEGTSYHGFARQAGPVTIQGVLEAAIASIGGAPARVVGAGRTDAGVHARGQVVSFTFAGSVPTSRLPAALNANLPPDVAVLAAREVAPGWDALRACAGKLYSYTVLNRASPSPMWRRFALHWPGPLDEAAMRAAASELLGRHDFRAFRSTGGSAKTTARHVSRCDIERQGDLLRILVEADGFLYNMVRIMAGTLLEVGRGAMTAGDVREALAADDRGRAGPTLPPHGLCLELVRY